VRAPTISPDFVNEHTAPGCYKCKKLEKAIGLANTLLRSKPGVAGARAVLRLALAEHRKNWITIRESDVGKACLKRPGRRIFSPAIGPVQPIDVGKRAYLVKNNAGDTSFWRVESNEQRDKRIAD